MTTTALFRWFQDDGSICLELRRDARDRVSVHALFLLLLLCLLVFVLPPFFEVYVGGIGARLHRLLEIQIEASDFLRQWFWLVIPFLPVVLFTDYKAYLHLHVKFGPRVARAWAHAITLVLVSANGFCLLSWLLFRISMMTTVRIYP